MVRAADLIHDEVYSKTGKVPVRCAPRIADGDNSLRKDCAWTVSFTSPVRPFRLFECSGLAYEFTRKPRMLLHNPGCQGYCDGHNCDRSTRCNHCSATNPGHASDECHDLPRCSNCYGPFPAGHRGCPAAPRKDKGRLIPIRGKELKAARAAGTKAYRRATTSAIVAENDESDGDRPTTQAPPTRLAQSRHSSKDKAPVITISPAPSTSGEDGSSAPSALTDAEDTITVATTAVPSPRRASGRHRAPVNYNVESQLAALLGETPDTIMHD